MGMVVQGPAGLLRFEKLRIEIVGDVALGARPRREQLRVTESDGSIYEGQLLSPSALGTGEKCERAFGFTYIDKLPRKTTKAQEIGTATHAELEAWLRDGVPPRSPLLTSSGALSHFPPPKAPGLLVETVFAFRVTLLRVPEALDVAGAREALEAGEDVSAVFYGYKDAQRLVDEAVPPLVEVYDLKTTSGLQWRKTTEELLTDTQSAVYAADALLEIPGAEVANLRWVYTQTKGAHASVPTDAAIDWQRLEQVLANRVARAWRLGALKVGMAKGTAKTLAPNPRACGDYGGCDFLSLCDDLKSSTGFMSLAKQSRLGESRKATGALPVIDTTTTTNRSEAMVSILAKMRSDIAKRDGDAAAGAAKAAQLEEAAPMVPVSSTVSPAPSVAPTPAPAPTPPPAPVAAAPAPSAPAPSPAPARPNPLKSIVAKMKGEALPSTAPTAPAATIATGINAPDARPPGTPDAAPSPAPAPVAPAPTPAAATEVAPEKRKPGRPKKEAPAPAPTAATPEGAPSAPTAAAPPAPAPAPSAALAPLPKAWADDEMPEALRAPIGFTLLLDVAPVKGMAFSNIEDVLSAARTKVEAEAGCSYRLIDYGKGPAFLAEQLEEDFKVEAPRGAFFASSYGLDKEVLDVLVRHAAVVFRATR
jgi:hypothetical protein